MRDVLFDMVGGGRTNAVLCVGIDELRLDGFLFRRNLVFCLLRGIFGFLRHRYQSSISFCASVIISVNRKAVYSTLGIICP